MHKISICMGSSCFSRGNNKNLKIIKDYVADKNITAEVELTGNLCENSCSSGPNIIINDVLYKRIEPICVVDLLEHTLKNP